MKQLQSIFTTPEQSKRLLELGVPADSADCWLTMSDEIFEDRHRPHVRTRGYETANSFFELRAESILPCWSVGRLIEIYELCYAQEFIRNVGVCLMEDVLSAIYDAVNDTTEQWDWLKLEDWL